MLYPGMARLVPLASAPRVRKPSETGSSLNQVIPKGAAGQGLAASPLGAPNSNMVRASPNPMQAVFTSRMPAKTNSRPVPGLSSPHIRGQKAEVMSNRVSVGHSEAYQPATGPSSSVTSALNDTSAVPARTAQSKTSFQQLQIGKIGVAAENFRVSEFNVVQVFAEALVFTGLVLLKWAVTLSTAQRVSAVIKVGLITLFFALHPIYAILTTIAVLAIYLYEMMHVRCPKKLGD